MSGFGFNEAFNKFHQELWLKNQQTLGAPVHYKNLIKNIFNGNIRLTPSLNDIETSINLSYSDSDAGETP